MIPNTYSAASLAILPSSVVAHLRPLRRNSRIAWRGISIGKPVLSRGRRPIHQPQPAIAPAAHLPERLAMADSAAGHDTGLILRHGTRQGRVSRARTSRGVLRTVVGGLRGGEAGVGRGGGIRAGGHFVRRVGGVWLRDDVRLGARVRAPRLWRRVLLLLVDHRGRRGRARERRVGEHLEGRVEGARGGLHGARERAGVFRDGAEGGHG